MNDDPLFKMSRYMRTRIYQAFAAGNYTKRSKTYHMLGCSFKTLQAYIEKLFTAGMSWDNQGKWHLDHILPLAAATTEEELIALSHHTNLQPLWAKDNISKGDKYCPKELGEYLNKMIEVA